jgi:hypothetical protein
LLDRLPIFLDERLQFVALLGGLFAHPPTSVAEMQHGCHALTDGQELTFEAAGLSG